MCEWTCNPHVSCRIYEVLYKGSVAVEEIWTAQKRPMALALTVVGGPRTIFFEEPNTYSGEVWNVSPVTRWPTVQEVIVIWDYVPKKHKIRLSQHDLSSHFFLISAKVHIPITLVLSTWSVGVTHVHSRIYWCFNSHRPDGGIPDESKRGGVIQTSCVFDVPIVGERL